MGWVDFEAWVRGGAAGLAAVAFCGGGRPSVRSLNMVFGGRVGRGG